MPRPFRARQEGSALKKTAIFCSALFLFISLPLFAEAKASPPAQAKHEVALLFSLENLISVTKPYNDGFQTGAGVKYWVSEKIGTRALLGMTVTPNKSTETSVTRLGTSIAGEYHPRPGKASPYIGGIAGIQFLFDDTGKYFNYSVGAIGGVELRLASNVALYGEYQAICLHDINGFGVRLGDQAILGIALYF